MEVDQKKISSVMTVTINVIRNKFPPRFTNLPMTMDFASTKTIGSNVFFVQATDNDLTSPFNKITFSISGDGAAIKAFNINPTSGQITLNTNLQAENINFYQVQVTVKDGGIPALSSTGTLKITIIRNFFEPRFNAYQSVISVNDIQAPDVSFFQFKATDADSVSPAKDIRFYANETASALSYFYIDTFNGSIAPRKNLYNANANPYKMVVYLYDMGSPRKYAQNPATISINVIRTNCPRFSNLPGRINLNPNTNTALSIYKVSQQPKDSSIYYDIIGEEDAIGIFRIDKTGNIYLSKSLLTETKEVYKVKIRIRNVKPTCENFGILTVQVERNKYAPTWKTPSPFSAQVYEDHKLNVPIYTLQAEDKDQPPFNQIEYEITQDNYNLFFVDSASGNVFNRIPFGTNRNLNLYTITVAAKEKGVNNPKSTTAILQITVRRNLFAPQFLNVPYSGQVTRSTTIGGRIFTALATDADTYAPFNTVTYEIIGDGVATIYFAIDKTTGIVSLSSALPSQPENKYYVRVLAKDQGPPSLSNTTVAEIVVKQIGAVPQYTTNYYFRNINETTTVGTNIINLQVINPPQQYRKFRLQGNTDETKYFTVDSSTGQIRLALPVYDDIRSQYSFKVMLSDTREPTREVPATILITVTRNDYAPIFIGTYNVTIPENELEGQSFTKVLATDRDQSIYNKIKYELIGDTPTPNYFTLDSISGAIAVKSTNNLMSDDRLKYVARVKAKDDGTPPKSATATVLINVQRNFFSPVFIQSTLYRSIPESSPLNSALVTVTAIDSDKKVPYNTVTYEMTGDQDAIQYFYLNPKSGVITVLKKLIKNTNMTIFVKAKDGGNPPRTASATVFVTVTATTNLVFTSTNYFANIDETVPKGANVIQVKALPENNNIYILKGYDPGTIYFDLTPNGWVNVKKNLKDDLSNIRQYKLLVEAQSTISGTKKIATAEVTINVKRNLNPPTFVQNDFFGQVRDVSPVGYSIMKISAKDNDKDVLKYTIQNTITNGLQANAYFYLSESTGELTLGSSLEKTQQNIIKFTVKVSDQRSPEKTDTATVTVTILRNQFSPQFLFTPYNVNIDENASRDYTVFSNVKAEDKDIQGTIKYEITGQGIAPYIFSLNSINNVVLINPDSLRQGTDTVYTLEIVAYDTVYPNDKAKTNLIINVIRNSSGPKFTSRTYTVTITDTHTYRQPIISVSATDQDKDIVRYNITGNARALTYYHINSDDGTIYLKTLLKGVSHTSDTINVEACDTRKNTKCDQAIVNVIIKKDSAPKFMNAPYKKTIPKTNIIGSNILNTFAQDPDNPPTIIYEILGEYPAQFYFGIKSNGEIYQKQSVKNRNQPEYNLLIAAYDPNNPTNKGYANATITVTLNPNPPITQGFKEVNISDTIQRGAEIARIVASDPDGDTLTYKMAGDLEDFKNFFVFPDSGIIIVKESLKGIKKSYVFEVIVSDGSKTAKTIVKVNVVLSTDKLPYFLRPPPTSTLIPKDYSTSQIFFTALAKDNDLKGSIIYKITGDTVAQNIFQIDSNTGQIKLSRSILTESVKSYKLQLAAFDSNAPLKSATSELIVNINLNPYAPVCQKSLYKISINESVPVATPVLQVFATDQLGDTLRYEMLVTSGGTTYNYFFMTGKDGNIYVKKDLSLDTTTSYRFSVRVSDQYNPPKSAICSVQIDVLRDTTLPVFLQPFTFQTEEVKPPGSYVGNVRAIDPDNNGKILYKLLPSGLTAYYFNFDTQTGSITVKENLKNDINTVRYDLQVAAYNTLFPKRTVAKNFTIIVRRNINSPIFQNVPYAVSIPDTKPLGNVIFTVTATDADKDTVVYNATGDKSALNYFYLTPDTGSIIVRRPLTENPNQNAIYLMTVIAKDQRNPEKTANAVVTINVIKSQSDIVFVNLPNRHTLTDIDPVSNIFFVVKSQWKNPPATGSKTILYKLEATYPALSFFSINAQTGAISLTSDLRRPGFTTTQFILNVVAYQDGKPQVFKKSQLTINVIRNPNPPVFTLQSYTATINENQNLFTKILQVTATDKDPKDTITYSLISQAANSLNLQDSYFYVEPDNGEILLRKSLKNSTYSRFSLKVQACDDGSPIRCSKVDVIISVEKNLHNPQFLQNPYTKTITETLSINSEVLTLLATDSDMKGTMFYEIAGSTTNLFTVEKTTGKIRVANSLLFAPTKVQFVVEAYDSKDPFNRGQVTVIINITKNPSGPYFLSTTYVGTVNKNDPIGASIVNTTAKDNDGDVLVYSLENKASNNDASYFFVVPNTGIIRLNRTLQTIGMTQFNFLVKASDNRYINAKTATADVTVNVIGPIQPPVFTTTNCDLRLMENQQIGNIFTVNAVSTQGKGNMQYKIDGIYPANDFFAIDGFGNVALKRLFTKDSLLQTSYTIKIFAFDTSAPDIKSQKICTISVSRSSPGPEFKPYARMFITIPENTAIGNVIYTINAVDSKGGTVEYRLLNTSTYFSLNKQSGQVTVLNDLTKAPNNLYTLAVEAVNQRGQKSQGTLQVLIQRKTVNLPKFSNLPSTATILADQSFSTSIFTVNANVINRKGNMKYEIEGLFPAENYFRIDANNGNVYVKKDLKNDPFRTEYKIQVVTYDDLNPLQKAKGILSVIVNRNPSSPIFQKTVYRKTIVEGQVDGKPILKVTATDLESGSDLFYSIVPNQQGKEAANFFYFRNNNGELYTSDLSTATKSTYRFDVQATDKGYPAKNAIATVEITILKDLFKPQFTQLSLTHNVMESTPQGAFLLRVQANDQDLKDKIQYVAIGDPMALALCNVNKDTGTITLRSSLKTVTVNSFLLKIQAYDSYFPNNRASVTVFFSIIRNSNVPRFNQPGYSFTVNEYHVLLNPVFRVTATDSDGDKINYQLFGNNIFYINSDTGEIYLRDQLHGKAPNFQLTVQATDDGQPPKSVNATVMVNVIRNIPVVITNANSTINIDPNSVQGKQLLTINASDQDKKGKLVYEVIGDLSAPTYFQVDKDSGLITLKTSLLPDNTPQYVLRVAVYDSAVPNMKTTATVTINVNRNKQAPFFLDSSYTKVIDPNTAISATVLTIRARDPENGNIIYSIVRGNNAENYFFVNPTTGQLLVINSLQPLNQKTLTFQVKATDDGTPARSSSILVTIIVRSSQTVPVFQQTTYSVNIRDSEQQNSVIITPKLSSTGQTKIKCKTIGYYPAPSFFSVDEDTCAVSVSRSLKSDAASTARYTLGISAYDVNNPNLAGYCNVTITVSRNPSVPIIRGPTNTQIIVPNIKQKNSVIVKVDAVDPDGDKLVYIMKGNQLVNQFFYINSNDGTLYLRESLLKTNTNQFQPVVSVVDNGQPPGSSDINLNIIIQKVPLPKFKQATYTTTVNENYPNTALVIKVDASVPNLNNIAYKVIGDLSAPTFFTVDNFGNVYSRGNLRTDQLTQYKLRVEAYNPSYPTYKDTALITINVNRNVNKPSFLIPMYTFNFDESTSPGTSVGKIQATDADKDPLSYYIVGPQMCIEHFMVNPNNGDILLIKKLPAPGTVYTCVMGVTDNGKPVSQNATTTVKVTASSNINPPSFSLPEYRTTVDESNPVGSLVTRISATGNPAFGQILYQVVGDYPSDVFFDVNNVTGVVRIKKDLRLDNLRQILYTLKIVAYYSGQPNAKAETKVYITTTRNSNVPVFNPSQVTLTIAATTSPGTYLKRLNVTDADSKFVTCKIINDASAMEFFQIDPNSCLLTLKKSLLNDMAQTSKFFITVEANDNGKPNPQKSTGFVIVDVTRVIIPKFENLPFVITQPESTNKGDLVYTVKTTKVATGNIVYEITGDNIAKNYFTVDRVNGEIRASQNLKDDPLKSTQYNIKIKAYNTNSPQDATTDTLIVKVSRNTNPPRFFKPLFSKSISNNFPVGQIILVLQATDLDNDMLTYSTMTTDPDVINYFKVQANGNIVLLKQLPSTSKIFTFPVKVSDNRTPEKTDTASVTINVTSSVSSPLVFVNTPYKKNIGVNTPVNTNIFRVEATSADKTNQIEYKFSGTTEGMEYFGINKITGDVYVKKDLSVHPGKKPVFYLFVSAYKISSPQITKVTIMEITVLKNQNTPFFIPLPPYFTNINDYDPVGTPVYNVNATDNDKTNPENRILYRLTDTKTFFSIDPNTGLITINKPLSMDAQKQKQYQLTIVAEDQGEPQKSAQATITIYVARNDNPPKFNITSNIVNIPDTVGPLTSVFRVTAQDPDPGKNGEIRYNLTGPDNARKLFEIDPVTGIIRTRISLKGQSQTPFPVLVTATDSGVDRKVSMTQLIFQVKSTDKPFFRSTVYETSVNENTPVGDSVFKVNAEDPSQPTLDLEYTVINTMDLFSMDLQGNIKVAKSLLNINIRQVEMNVKAYRKTDPNQSTTTTVKIKIISGNNPPVFTESFKRVTISDDFPTGGVILTVKADDQDQGENGRITYNIISVNPAMQKSYFYVNPITGQLTVISLLSGIKNGPKQYILIIEAKDNGYPQNQATMTVTVDVIGNRNAPIFTQNSYTFTIDETARLNSSVGNVTATDADKDKVFYSIPIRNKDARYFSINKVTGHIVVAGDIVSDTRDQYTFQVTAVDNSTSPKKSEVTVYVNVLRNLNPPVFVQKVYNATISEYTAIQTFVIQVRATDQDAIRNPLSQSGKLVYSIVPSSEYFFISQNQGNIYVKNFLTTDKIGNTVSLTVRATDQSSQPKTATASVFITITRNQFSPEISPKLLTADIETTYPLMTPIVQFTVSDKDRIINGNNPNGEIKISIPAQYQNIRSIFEVSNVGVVYLKQSLMNTNSAVYKFVVVASDNSWKPKTAEANVVINVTRVEVQSGDLKFGQPFYALHLKENTPIGSVILNLKVTNIVMATRIVCKLVNNYGKFSIVYNLQTSSCQLKILNEIDYETDIRVYDLVIDVTYSKDAKRAATTLASQTKVNVRIVDVNDNAPKFKFPDNTELIPDTYLGILSSQAGVNVPILSVSATDADSGTFGDIKYSINDPVPFSINEATIYNTDVYKAKDPINYHFKVVASDLAPISKTTVADTVINIVFDQNRLTLRIPESPRVVGAKQAFYVKYLTQLYNKTAMIETARATYDNSGITLTELIFVLVQNTSPYLLVNVTKQEIKGKLDNNLGLIQDAKPEIVGYLPQTSVMRTKSYIWWMDDPWAALVALAAIIILLCLIGIIVVLFTWSRYTKYLNQYRLHHLANEPTEFLEPPSLKNFETQSLNMYVPADEAERELGEINMTFEGDTLRRVEHQGADPNVASAVNPLFNQHSQEGPQTTGHTETTTIL